jgi:uncharacterized surface protein with fasciclin (FAS1) repeats
VTSVSWFDLAIDGNEGDSRVARLGITPQPEKRSNMKKMTVLVTASALTFLAACGDDESTVPTEAPATEAPATEAPATEELGDIVAVASGAGSFSTLVAAVEAAGLVETLQGEGPFTVFAPTDEAFAALPAGLLDKLLMPENKDLLAKILTYHVVAGKVMAADVMAGEVATVEGQNITLGTEGGVTVNGANVVTADVEASNGVIHVIDAVILPPDVDPSAL